MAKKTGNAQYFRALPADIAAQAQSAKFKRGGKSAAAFYYMRKSAL
jgi:hypothetical protein